MIRSFRLLRGYMVREFLGALAWRGFMTTVVINQVVTPLIGLAVWSAVLGGNAVTSYYVALLVIQLMTVSYEHHTLSNNIYDGGISRDLLQPRPVVLVTLGANLAFRVWHVLIGLPLFGLVWLISGASFGAMDVVLALPALVLAATLRFLYTYTLALLAFWTQQAHGVVAIGETLVFLLGGIAVPLALFPADYRVLGLALPFRAIMGFPAEIITGSLDMTEIVVGYGWQVAWIAVFAFAAAVTWRAGLRRFTAVGG